jgi:hypothetical protein
MKKKSVKMIRAGKKSWATRHRNMKEREKIRYGIRGTSKTKTEPRSAYEKRWAKGQTSEVSKRFSKRQVVGFYRENGTTKPITKSVLEIERKKIIREPSSFKGVQPINKLFKFEHIDYVWKDGKTREMERMRIRKESAGTITHLRIEHLVPATKGDAFFKSPRTGMVEVANEHIAMLGVPTFKEYYLVSESFTAPNSGDPLGGFVSGRIWEITNKPKFLEVLENYRRQGWWQVPYVQDASTCRRCGKSLSGEPVASFRARLCRSCYRKSVRKC